MLLAATPKVESIVVPSGGWRGGVGEPMIVIKNRLSIDGLPTGLIEDQEDGPSGSGQTRRFGFRESRDWPVRGPQASFANGP